MALPSKWGPERTNKDYEFLMAGDTCVSEPNSLLGHAVTSPSQELTDPVTVPVISKVRGKIRTTLKVIAPAEQTSVSYTILAPSALWTPLLAKAKKGGLCYTDFYALYLCPEDAKFEHAYIYPDSTLAEPSEVGDFIVNTDTAEVLTEQTTLTTDRRVELYKLSPSLLRTQAVAINAGDFLVPDCVGCTNGLPWTDMVVAGEPVSEAAPSFFTTEDRYSSQVTSAIAVPADSIITDIYTEGDTVLATFSDAAIATGTTGGVAASFDGGPTSVVDSGITASMHGVTRLGGIYVAVGGTGAGAPLAYTSLNGIDWVTVSSGVLTGTDALNKVAADQANETLYAVGEGGLVLRGTLNGNTVAFEDISANLPGSPGLLSAVHVLSDGHVLIGGASGYLAESFDGGETFTSVPFISTDAVTGIAGSCYRTLVVAGSDVYERSVLKLNKWVALGVDTSDDFTFISMPEGELNYAMAGTDGGDVFLLKPYLPQS